MKYILVDQKMPQELVEKLKVFPYELVKTRTNKNINSSLNSHPDILVHALPNGDIICDRDNFSYYRDKFKGRKLFMTEKSLGDAYENHVYLNAFFYENYLVGNLKLLDKNLLNFYRQKNFELINVKQGYSKCSSLVTNKFIATSDMGIYKALRDKINVIKINHKEIILKDYPYGFIGGASGFIDNNLILTGSLGKHSSGYLIEIECQKEKLKILELGQNILEDFGSILLI